jgi:hypothetical protein
VALTGMYHNLLRRWPNAVRFLSPIADGDTGTESFGVLAVVPNACTMSKMTVRVDAGMEAGVSATFTLRKGATLASLANTALSCAVSSATTTCTSTGAISMSASDLIDVRLGYSAGSTGPANNFLISLVCQ